MKKIMLLLGALSLVSSVAYAKEVVPAVEEVAVVEEVKPVAAPALTVTSIGQYVEVDNTSGGSDIGQEVYFGNTVNFAYGEDWTFQVLAAKIWDMDTDDIESRSHRIEIGGWRHFDNFSLGMKWRGQQEYDRLYLRTKYNYGMFSGWVDLAYQANNEKETTGVDDVWYSEGMPVMFTYGPVTVGYYYEMNDYAIGDTKKGEKEYSLDHQLRVMFPLYTGEKLTLGAEYRWQFAQDQDYDNAGYQEKTGHKAILKAAYAVTDNFSVDGYYRYDFNEYEAKDGLTKDAADNYYGEFYIGWNYTF